jgi:antitoxin (DNA-binding transcriptional repressor) of toxin-antitoxin stability system
MTNTAVDDKILRISVRDYNRNYTKYLEQVENLGRSFVITQKDKEVAVLNPIENKKKLNIIWQIF